MFLSFGGNCLPPPLPPLPPPPNFFQPPNWMTSSCHSLASPPAPLPPPFFFPPPMPPPPHQLSFSSSTSQPSGGLLPRPAYSETSNFTPPGVTVSRGRSGPPRGICRGERGRGNYGRQRWKIQKCESCDRVYKNEETFAEHMQSHVKCAHCDFTALPKKVKEHSQVHNLPDFLSFSSPIEIKKWREERKKNFPTVSKVAKKMKSAEERKDRGQVIDTPLYRYVNQLIGDYDSRCRGRGGRGGRRGGSSRGGGGRRNNAQRHNNKSGSRKSFSHDTSQGPTHIATSTSAAIEDAKPTVGTRPQGGQSPSPSNESRESCRGRRNNNRRKRRQTYPKNSFPSKRAKQCHWTELPSAHQPTLLEKLLAPSIRRERNVILQCVRHTIKNNFFDSASTTSTSTTTTTTTAATTTCSTSSVANEAMRLKDN